MGTIDYIPDPRRSPHRVAVELLSAVSVVHGFRRATRALAPLLLLLSNMAELQTDPIFFRLTQLSRHFLFGDVLVLRRLWRRRCRRRRRRRRRHRRRRRRRSKRGVRRRRRRRRLVGVQNGDKAQKRLVVRIQFCELSCSFGQLFFTKSSTRDDVILFKKPLIRAPSPSLAPLCCCCCCNGVVSTV